MAQSDVPQRGSHDTVLAPGRRNDGNGSRRTTLVYSLGGPVPEPDGVVAKLSIAIVVRRDGDYDLPDRQSDFHLHGINPGLRGSP